MYPRCLSPPSLPQKSSRKLLSAFESFESRWDILTLEDNDPRFFHAWASERRMEPSVFIPTNAAREDGAVTLALSVFSTNAILVICISRPSAHYVCYAPFLQIQRVCL